MEQEALQERAREVITSNIPYNEAHQRELEANEMMKQSIIKAFKIWRKQLSNNLTEQEINACGEQYIIDSFLADMSLEIRDEAGRILAER
jgi:hypothetical protein